MRISDWSSDVCSSDLAVRGLGGVGLLLATGGDERALRLYELVEQTGRRFAEIVAEFPEADRRVAAIGLFEPDLMGLPGRSEERRVGKECVSTWRSRWSPYN